MNKKKSLLAINIVRSGSGAGWELVLVEGNDEGKKACNNNVIVLYIH